MQDEIRKSHYVEHLVMNSLCETSAGSGIDWGLWGASVHSVPPLFYAAGLVETGQPGSFSEKAAEALGGGSGEGPGQGKENSRQDSSQSPCHLGSGRAQFPGASGIRKPGCTLKSSGKQYFVRLMSGPHPQRV